MASSVYVQNAIRTNLGSLYEYFDSILETETEAWIALPYTNNGRRPENLIQFTLRYCTCTMATYEQLLAYLRKNENADTLVQALQSSVGKPNTVNAVNYMPLKTKWYNVARSKHADYCAAMADLQPVDLLDLYKPHLLDPTATDIDITNLSASNDRSKVFNRLVTQRINPIGMYYMIEFVLAHMPQFIDDSYTSLMTVDQRDRFTQYS